MQGKYLITADSWFFAKDGKQYRAAYGEVDIISDDFLGVRTNAKSSNWFARVSGKNDSIIIAGCQIHYALKTDDVPHTDLTLDNIVDSDGNVKYFDRPTQIYIVE